MSVDGHEEPEYVIEHALGAIKARLYVFVSDVLNADEATAAQWAKVRARRSAGSSAADKQTSEDARALIKDIRDLPRPFLAAFTEGLAGDATGANDLLKRVSDNKFINLCNNASHGERVSVGDAVKVVETLTALAALIGADVEALHLQAPLATLRDRIAWKKTRSAPQQRPVKAGVTCVGVHWVQPRRVVPGSWWIVALSDGSDTVVEVDLTSSEVVDYLTSLEVPTVAGLAFCFSAPQSFVERNPGETIEDLWRWCSGVAGDDDLAKIPPDLPKPFRHVEHLRRPDESDSVHFRKTERDIAKELLVEPASIFDIGGEGSVGALAIKGMPMLAALRDAGAAIWPIDPPLLDDGLTCVEIFPRAVWTSLYPAEYPRSKKNVMRRWNFIADLRDHRVNITSSRAKEIAADERAFDALLTAWALRRYAGTLRFEDDAVAAIEGKIWFPT